MHMSAGWMGSPKAAGFVGGTWCWAAASLALHNAAPASPLGAELLRWLARDGMEPSIMPLAIASLVVVVHAIRIREAHGQCCREWIDAAWSLGLVAVGIVAWSWALHYEPFSDPYSGSRQLAGVAGFGSMLVGAGMTIAAAVASEWEREVAATTRPVRRSWEAIG
jgi:hypothetical protein